MKLQQLLSYTRKAVEDYHMIEEGDKIAIGISGGKDSLALLYSLANMRRFYPKHYSLIAITCDLGFKNVVFILSPKFCCFIKLNYNHAQKMIFLPGRTFQGQTVLGR